MKLSNLIAKIGLTVCFPLLGLSALLGEISPVAGQIAFGFFIASLMCGVQFFIVLIWKDKRSYD